MLRPEMSELPSGPGSYTRSSFLWPVSFCWRLRRKPSGERWLQPVCCSWSERSCSAGAWRYSRSLAESSSPRSRRWAVSHCSSAGVFWSIPDLGFDEGDSILDDDGPQLPPRARGADRHPAFQQSKVGALRTPGLLTLTKGRSRWLLPGLKRTKR